MILLSTEDYIVVNKYSQQLIDKQEVFNWFNSFSNEDKKNILKIIWQLSLQARLKEEYLPKIIERSALKITSTPVVMILSKKNPFTQRGYNLMRLEGTQMEQAFSLLIDCYAYADGVRRKNEDPETCTHWWHRDLSDESVVADILLNHDRIKTARCNEQKQM